MTAAKKAAAVRLSAWILFTIYSGFSIITPSAWPYVESVTARSGSNSDSEDSSASSASLCGGSSPVASGYPALILGLAWSSFCLGGVIGNPVFGWLAGRKPEKEEGQIKFGFKSSSSSSSSSSRQVAQPVRFALLVAAALVVVGGLVYTWGNAVWAMLLGRFLQGLGGGCSSVLESFVASVHTPEERTSALAVLNVFGQLGFAAGPLVGALLALLPPLELTAIGLSLTCFSTPGLYASGSAIVSAVLLLLFFDEHAARNAADLSLSRDVRADSHRSRSVNSRTDSSVQDRAASVYNPLLGDADSELDDASPDAAAIDERLMGSMNSRRSTHSFASARQHERRDTDTELSPLIDAAAALGDAPQQPKAAWWMIGLYVAVLFCLFNELSVYETLATPIVMSIFGWTIFETGFMWTGISLISLLSMLCLRLATRLRVQFAGRSQPLLLSLLSDPGILMSMLVMQLTALALLSSFNNPSAESSNIPVFRFLLGTGLIAFAFPAGNVALISVFTQLPLERLEFSVGILMGGASAARLVGPLWGALALSAFGDGFVFLLLFVILLIGTAVAATALWLSSRKRKK